MPQGHRSAEAGNGLPEAKGIQGGQHKVSHQSKMISRENILAKQNGFHYADQGTIGRNWYERGSERQSMQYLIPSQRIDIIYEHHVHGGNAIQVARRFNFNYTTVINALKGYQENGRIFKLLPVHSK